MGYEPNTWMILPFGLLLAAIALCPLTFPEWWMKHYAKVAVLLGAITVGYYLFVLPDAARKTLGHTGMHYVEFIALIGSLFVVSGGIHITVKGEATPAANVVFLLVGALLANLLGTTGASMLLIRPWIRMNKYRVTVHHVVFFIFIVSNVGGCLTPIGDPPLFLGYLRGVPFTWVFKHCWMMWVVGIGYLLAVFYVLDLRNYNRAPKSVRDVSKTPEKWRFEGLWNLVFLGIILGAVFIHKPLFLREGIMVAAAVASYFTTRKAVHEANQFNFHPIQEVIILFLGIFATMMPALDWLEANARTLVGANPSAALFFWGSGTLSSFLDNAPTYLGFLSAMGGIFVTQDVVTQVQHLISMPPDSWASASEPIRNALEALQSHFSSQLATQQIGRGEIEIAYILGNLNLNIYLVAVSIGSVFFGACTYIGNGPNFMVKSIAYHQKVRCPTFITYVFNWTLPILLPLLIFVWLIFFRS